MNNLLPILLALVSAISIALLLQALFSFFASANKSTDRRKALARYGRVVSQKRSAQEQPSNSALGALIDRYRLTLERQLQVADLKVSSISWMAGQTLFVMTLFGLINIQVQNTLPSFILAVGVTYLVSRLVITSRIEKRRTNFETNLPISLQLLASGIRSGLSFDQAIESISIQDRTEVGKQFRQAIAEASLDGELEKALLDAAKRMKSDDLRWLVSALQIQREIGGSLSNILDNVAETIRVRADVRREVRVLSAEGKLSGYVLIAMPFVVLLALLAIRPSYVTFFWTDPVGMVMGLGFLALVAVGWVWLQRIVKVKA